MEIKRVYRKANINGMKEDINSIDWEDILKTDENSMDEIITVFNKKIQRNNGKAYTDLKD